AKSAAAPVVKMVVVVEIHLQASRKHVANWGYLFGSILKTDFLVKMLSRLYLNLLNKQALLPDKIRLVVYSQKTVSKFLPIDGVVYLFLTVTSTY
ncbi:hypothetical protein VT98_11081, partial [Candidatus Electrothrix communis]